MVGDNLIASCLDRSQYVVLHVDAAWDVKYRPRMRESIRVAATVFGDSVMFGEIDCDLPAAAAFCRRLGVANVPAVVYFRGRHPIAVICHLHDVAEQTAAILKGRVNAGLPRSPA